MTFAFTLKGQAGTRKVWLNEKPLDPSRSQAIWNHSPDGFNWGYSGSGPSQLALSVLLELMPQEQAIRYYGDFRSLFLARLTMDKSFNRMVTIDILDNGLNITRDAKHTGDQQ